MPRATDGSAESGVPAHCGVAIPAFTLYFWAFLREKYGSLSYVGHRYLRFLFYAAKYNPNYIFQKPIYFRISCWVRVNFLNV